LKIKKVLHINFNREMLINFLLKKSSLKSVSSLIKKRLTTRVVLGIETSCDDTAVGVVSTDRKILAESKYNQWSMHRKLGHAKKNSQWSGGVWPNLAKRLHSENLIYAVSDCIEQMPNGWSDIDAIAVATRPGLEICLYEGINFAKLLLKKYKLPFIPIHHMEAHALTSRLFDLALKFPFLTLLISGGHSLLVLVEDYDKFSLLGTTLDSSPGSCFDKVARDLGLFEIDSRDEESSENMSGGALVEKYATQIDRIDKEMLNFMTEKAKLYCGKFSFL
jgi:N6-L-threonylcarbamoyladenine synthase